MEPGTSVLGSDPLDEGYIQGSLSSLLAQIPKDLGSGTMHAMPGPMSPTLTVILPQVISEGWTI